MWDDDGWRSDMDALAILDGSNLLDDHGRVGVFAQGVRDALADLAARAERDPTQGLVPEARPRKGVSHVAPSVV